MTVSEESTEQRRAREVAERAERALKRNQVRQEAYTAEQMKEIIKSSPGFSAPAPAQIANGIVADEANFVDWSNIEDGQYMWSVEDDCMIKIFTSTDEVDMAVAIATVEEGFRVVDGPKSIQEALRHPKWASPTSKEVSTLKEGTRTLLQVDQEIAKQQIANGCECLILFPVYEEKIKDGELVYKVRLVANGKKQKQFGESYSPTPSREELLIYIH